MWMASGRRTEEKESWWRGLSAAAGDHPRVLSPFLKSLTHPGVNESRSGRRQGVGAGRAEHQDQIAPSSPPAHPEPPPCSQAVPSRLHLPCKRLTFKILSEDSFLHSLPFTSPSKKENSR